MRHTKRKLSAALLCLVAFILSACGSPPASTTAPRHSVSCDISAAIGEDMDALAALADLPPWVMRKLYEDSCSLAARQGLSQTGTEQRAIDNVKAWLAWRASNLHSPTHKLGAIVNEQGLRLNQISPPNADVSFNSHKAINLANGTVAGDAVPIGQDATSSLDGLMAAADKLRHDQRNAGPRFFYEDWDDFECGGADSTGAATLVTAISFCKLQWRVALLNSGTAKLVATGQDSNHWGVVQLETVTNAASASAIGRFAPSTPVFIFGSGQTIYDEWEVQIPTLSDATNTFTVDAGYASGMGSITPSDGVYLEESSATPSSGNWIGRVCVSSVCTNVTTTPVAAVAGEWERVSVAYDGAAITFAAKGTTIGTTTTPPSVALASFAQNVRQAGTVSRTALFDWNYDRRIVSAGRSP